MQCENDFEMQRTPFRVYPDPKMCDSVNTYKKKAVLMKEGWNRWSDNIHIVEYMTDSHGKKLFKLSARERFLFNAMSFL